MYLITQRRSGKQQPTRPLRIDRRNPINKDLAAVFYGKDGYADVSQGLIAPAGAIWTPTPYGPGLDGQGSTSNYCLVQSNVSAAYSSGNYAGTLVALVMPASTAAQGFASLVNKNAGGDLFVEFALGIDSGGNLAFWQRSNTRVFAPGIIPAVAGTPYFLACSQLSASQRTFCVNGKISTDSTSMSPYSGTFDCLSVAGIRRPQIASNSYAANGPVIFSAWFNRPLSSTELKWLSGNMLQQFEPQSRRWFVPEAGAANATAQGGTGTSTGTGIGGDSVGTANADAEGGTGTSTGTGIGGDSVGTANADAEGGTGTSTGTGIGGDSVGTANADAEGGTGTSTGSGTGGTAIAGGAGDAEGGTGTSTGSGTGGDASGATAVTFTTDILINNAGSVLASTLITWEWRQGGVIGSTPISVTYGSGTTNGSGVLTLSGIPAGAGEMFAREAIGTAYYQAGTAA